MANEMVPELIDALGGKDKIETYGKGAIVGIDGVGAVQAAAGKVIWRGHRGHWLHKLDVGKLQQVVEAGRLDAQAHVAGVLVFVDQFDQENSRDIEPVSGLHHDHYYYQLESNPVVSA